MKSYRTDVPRLANDFADPQKGAKKGLTPQHRLNKMLKLFDLTLSEKIHQMPPLGFRESLFLWKDSLIVMTDSGGLQEETTALGVPCLTLRQNTERPITCEIGTNRLVGNDPQRIMDGFEEVMNGGGIKGEVPPKWDGRAAERIVHILSADYAD